MNDKRKESESINSKTAMVLMKQSSLPKEKVNGKKGGHAKTNSLVDCPSSKLKENEDGIDANWEDNEEDHLGFNNISSKDGEDKSPMASASIKKPRKSFDVTMLQSQNKSKQMSHILSSFSAKKDKASTQQKNVYAGYSAAGRNFRGEVKVNQDSFMTLQHIFNISFNYHVLAVFDGHGPNGHFISDFLKNFFTKYFTSNDGVNLIKKWVFSKAKEKAECFTLMKKNYVKAEEMMVKSGIEYKNSGSTGVIVAILIDVVICFNTGDSRAIYISSDGQTHQITEDHKPKSPNEEKRIVKQGGRVESQIEDNKPGPFRVFSKNNNQDGLAISRSIGDFEMKEAGVTSEPDYFELSVRAHRIKAIVLGSDGIWDVLTNDMVKEIIEPYFTSKDALEAAKELVEVASEEWLDKGVNVDDISVIVYFT